MSKHKLKKRLYSILTIAGVIGFIASFLQMVEKIELLKNPSAQLACNLNAIFSCSNILNTWQSSVFGFPNSLMCIIFFVIMITAGLIGWMDGSTSKTLRMVFMGVAVFFVGFGFWYLWQSIVIVGAICVYCIFCYGSVLVITGSWFRLNYQELNVSKKVRKIIDKIVIGNFDILILCLIALAVITEAIAKFA